MSGFVLLTPEEIIRDYPATAWAKTAPTRMKEITQEDIVKIGSSFIDLEGLVQQVALGRFLCVGAEGERWTRSRASVERDCVRVSGPDGKGFSLYRNKQARSVLCFDIPFAFSFTLRGKTWRSQSDGGIVTWNGAYNSRLEMRLIKRSIFLTTYTQSQG